MRRTRWAPTWRLGGCLMNSGDRARDRSCNHRRFAAARQIRSGPSNRSIFLVAAFAAAPRGRYDNSRRGKRLQTIGFRVDCRVMGLPRQTVVLLGTARQLVAELPADAVLLLTEKQLDWETVLEHLAGCRLLVAAQDQTLTGKLKEHPGLTVLDIDPGPTPTQERMSLALLEAIASEKLQPGAHVIALYNGIEADPDQT